MVPIPPFVVPQPAPGENPRAGFVYPAWMDPLFMVTASTWRDTLFTPVPGPPTRIVTGDAKRWAIGFTSDQASIDTFQVYPGRGVSNHGFMVPSGGGQLWMTLFEKGPLVCAEWWCIPVGVSPITVWELFLI